MMTKLKLRGKDLRALGFPEGPVISIAMNIMEKQSKFEKQEKVMTLLREILTSPVEYAGDAVLGLIAQQLLPKAVHTAHCPDGWLIGRGTALSGRRLNAFPPSCPTARG
jgi:hypothetical protein